MKKLELKNLKVVKLSKVEKLNVNGGRLRTSTPCNEQSGPYVSWCHSCPSDQR